MKELIDAVQALDKRDAWDFIAMVAPLILSGVAIWISLRTTQKQNKIALFDKRYKAYSILVDLMTVAQAAITDTSANGRQVLDSKMSKFILTITHPEINPKSNNYIDFYLSLSMEANKIEYLFNLKGMKYIDSFLNAFNKYTVACYLGRPSEKEKEGLVNSLKALEENKVVSAIDKCIKL